MNQKSVFEYLDLLLNKKIDVIGRSANLLWIGLGKQITVLDWKKREGAVYIVNYKLNELNDLTIYLSNKERIEIYANASDDSEFWRIFKCGVDEKHLVATGFGVEFQ